MPYQDARGTWISDDGRSYWDGGAWRPVAPVAVQAPQYVPPPPVAAAPQPIAYAPAPAYVGAPPAAVPGSARAGWALGLGIFSLLAWLLPILGLPVAIVAIVLGGTSRRGGSAMATWGMVLGIIGLALSLINAAFGVYLKTTGQM